MHRLLVCSARTLCGLLDAWSLRTHHSFSCYCTIYFPESHFYDPDPDPVLNYNLNNVFSLYLMALYASSLYSFILPILVSSTVFFTSLLYQTNLSIIIPMESTTVIRIRYSFYSNFLQVSTVGSRVTEIYFLTAIAPRVTSALDHSILFCTYVVAIHLNTSTSVFLQCLLKDCLYIWILHGSLLAFPVCIHRYKSFLLCPVGLYKPNLYNVPN